MTASKVTGDKNLNKTISAENRRGQKHAKLEKADILELTVTYLQTLKKTDEQKFVEGFEDCSKETVRFLEKSKISPSIIDKLMTHLKNIREGSNGEVMMTGNGSSPSLLPSTTASSSTSSSGTLAGRLTIGADEALSNASPFPLNSVQPFGLSPASVKSEPVKSSSKRSKQQHHQQQTQQLLFMDTSSNHSLSPSNCSSPSSTHNPNDSNNNNLSTSSESYHHHHSSYNTSNGTSNQRFLSSAETLRLDYSLPSTKRRSRSNSSRSDSSGTTKQHVMYVAPASKSESQSQMMEQDLSNNTDCNSAAINLCVTPHSSRDSPACSSSAGSVIHLDSYPNAPHDNDYQMYSEYEPLDFSRPLNLCKNESYRFIPEEGVWRPW
ncbi:Transcription factor HES-1-A [Orchesella cincta]|uniref:Transcription factor HES-1-A n=1 Tax=Orchesella cincta TaxID=48709 RepID=A0A1D2MWU4_ORCCI|nr:Transcription factor HES-1-A [Orchesella cincta]